MSIDVRGLFLIAESGDCSLPVVCGLLASLVAEHGALDPWASILADRGFCSCGSWFQSTGSVFVGHGFSCSVACGIFMEQGSDSGILHWQVDS